MLSRNVGGGTHTPPSLHIHVIGLGCKLPHSPISYQTNKPLQLLYLFLTSIPYSFQLERHWTPGVGALPFLSMTAGVFVGAILIILDVKLRFQPLFARSPELITPETRLPVMIAGSFILPIGLFWFAWTSSPKINPAPQIISGVVTGCGILMIFMQGLNYIVDVYRLNANSGIAANTMLRNVFGAAFPLFGMQLYDRLGVPWATSLLAFLAVAFIPGPLLFYVYGKRIREKSKFSFKQ
jgi:DHA1 family multidrug resistance protein-like MFS transporter